MTDLLKARCIYLVRQRALSICPESYPGAIVMPCEVCGHWGYPRELHHRQFRSRQGLWVPSNILLLCPACHLMATDEKTSPGVNVHSWEDPLAVPVQLWYVDAPVYLDNRGGYSPCCRYDTLDNG